MAEPSKTNDHAPAETGAALLTFDVVIATRNRPEALALSIPLLLSQSRQPKKLIVIDSSDDHAPVAQVVAETTKDWGGEVIVEHSEKGLPYQRNRGLAHVTADVVIFPDDDSLLYTGTSAAIMDVYERDTEGTVAAVCAAEALEPPEQADLGKDYEMTAAHRVEARTRLWRNRMEKRFSQLKPAIFLGQIFASREPFPDWLRQMDCVPVEYMTGFRMSFRTAAIKPVGFDDVLRDYALDEDIDASFTAARSGLVVGALRARIYHHRFPGGRGNGYTLGAMALLNRVYVVLKHSALGGLSENEAARARRRVSTFIWLKILASLPGVRSSFGRERLRGAWVAAGPARQLLQAGQGDLAEAYRAAQSRLGL